MRAEVCCRRAWCKSVDRPVNHWWKQAAPSLHFPSLPFIASFLKAKHYPWGKSVRWIETRSMGRAAIVVPEKVLERLGEYLRNDKLNMDLIPASILRLQKCCTSFLVHTIHWANENYTTTRNSATRPIPWPFKSLRPLTEWTWATKTNARPWRKLNVDLKVTACPPLEC